MDISTTWITYPGWEYGGMRPGFDELRVGRFSCHDRLNYYLFCPSLQYCKVGGGGGGSDGGQKHITTTWGF